jgi:hypothetical protein
MSPNKYVGSNTCISVDQFVCRQAESYPSTAVHRFLIVINNFFLEEFSQFKNFVKIIIFDI